MLLVDVLEEYYYVCKMRGYTKKTMLNKWSEYNKFLKFLTEQKQIVELEEVTIGVLRSYMRYKQEQALQLQPQSIVSMFKIIKAFFSWCEREEYLKTNVAKRVDLPKVPKVVLNPFTAEDVEGMVNAFTYNGYIEVRNKTIIMLLSDCGLRSSEIRWLQSENVRDTDILVYGKGNKERLAYISPILKRTLIKYERAKKEYFKDKDTTSHYFLSYKGT
ncbi:tyrosine-type recombinase/integrase [Salipaludibacillus neizhouensis]|uniref:tyrosine-type recombinase/integrase n=1 Tax=Salipaludibacillus neizhouensis TaxID=885475 RepID=UPI001CBA657E|nr:phage integrase SAM-like domain-containing protein [Salipaludibacillus neizhouensis]